jgi:hypothetical protein
MNTVQDHPDIEKLPLEMNGIPVRETIREIFRNPENGTPDNISKAGCLVLARNRKTIWNAWRQEFPSKTQESFLGERKQLNSADFSDVDFDEELVLDFSEFEFGDLVNFERARASFRLTFARAQFGKGVKFTGSSWGHGVNFEKTTWSGAVDFQAAQFGYGTNFSEVNWVGRVNFVGAQFAHHISFKGSRWQDVVDFSATEQMETRGIYSSDADYEAAIKWGELRGASSDKFGVLDFSNAVFFTRVFFSDRKFISTTKFERTCFRFAPIFHGCELHQDTSFEGAKFPEPTGSEEAAGAYRTLKLAFSKQQAIREEQRFFRLEMEEETLRETGLKRWLFQAYKTFSDYGFSITRPLKYGCLSVLTLTAVYGLLSWLGQCALSTDACHFAPQWLEFSLLQTLPLPGLDKLSEVASEAFWPGGAWWSLGLSALVIVHKTISLVALFLIGLALRNLFKLK